MRKLVAAAGLAAVGLVAALAFGAPAEAQMTPTVPVIVKDAASPHWRAVLAGARKAGRDLGVKIVELTGKGDADNGADLLRQALALNPAAIVIAPAEGGALGGALDEAAKKAKVVGLESSGGAKAMSALLTGDDVNAGRIAADALAAAITKSYADTEGNVAMIAAAPGAALGERAKGFKEVVAAKYGALAITTETVADGKAATMLGAMKDVIAKTADLRGVFAEDPATAHAVAQALAEKKNDDLINMVAIGADDDLVKLLQDGRIAALVVEDPFKMGYESVKIALAAAKGEPVAAATAIPATLLTKADLASPRAQELLKPVAD